MASVLTWEWKGFISHKNNFRNDKFCTATDHFMHLYKTWYKHIRNPCHWASSCAQCTPMTWTERSMALAIIDQRCIMTLHANKSAVLECHRVTKAMITHLLYLTSSLTLTKAARTPHLDLHWRLAEGWKSYPLPLDQFGGLCNLLDVLLGGPWRPRAQHQNGDRERQSLGLLTIRVTAPLCRY